jgi:hypothetical protein
MRRASRCRKLPRVQRHSGCSMKHHSGHLVRSGLVSPETGRHVRPEGCSAGDNGVGGNAGPICVGARHSSQTRPIRPGWRGGRTALLQPRSPEW